MEKPEARSHEPESRGLPQKNAKDAKKSRIPRPLTMNCSAPSPRLRVPCGGNRSGQFIAEDARSAAENAAAGHEARSGLPNNSRNPIPPQDAGERRGRAIHLRAERRRCTNQRTTQSATSIAGGRRKRRRVGSQKSEARSKQPEARRQLPPAAARDGPELPHYSSLKMLADDLVKFIRGRDAASEHPAGQQDCRDGSGFRGPVRSDSSGDFRIENRVRLVERRGAREQSLNANSTPSWSTNTNWWVAVS